MARAGRPVELRPGPEGGAVLPVVPGAHSPEESMEELRSRGTEEWTSTWGGDALLRGLPENGDAELGDEEPGESLGP